VYQGFGCNAITVSFEVVSRSSGKLSKALNVLRMKLFDMLISVTPETNLEYQAGELKKSSCARLCNLRGINSLNRTSMRDGLPQ